MTPSNRILILDDEEIIRIALRETVISGGYSVIMASHAKEALEILTKEEVSVILSDQRMPGMTGLEFLAEAKKIQPNTTRILITGVVNLKTVINAVNHGEIYRFLAKPWIREDLLITIQNGIQRYNLLCANEKLKKDVLRLNESITQNNQELHDVIKELEAENQDQRKQLASAHLNIDKALDISIHERTLTSESAITTAIKEVQLLCQSNQLSKEEQLQLQASTKLFFISKNFSSDSHALMQGFSGALAGVYQIINAAQEKWDGTGKPYGLKHAEIPKISRILSIILFYAQSTDSKEKTIENILKHSGTDFDPSSVRLFLRANRQVKLSRKSQEISFKNLRPGMILAKDICTPSGIPILNQGFCLDNTSINKIRRQLSIFKKQDKLLIYTQNEQN